jgi:hypothetical protein
VRVLVHAQDLGPAPVVPEAIRGIHRRRPESHRGMRQGRERRAVRDVDWVLDDDVDRLRWHVADDTRDRVAHPFDMARHFAREHLVLGLVMHAKVRRRQRAPVEEGHGGALGFGGRWQEGRGQQRSASQRQRGGKGGNERGSKRTGHRAAIGVGGAGVCPLYLAVMPNVSPLVISPTRRAHWRTREIPRCAGGIC